MPFARSWPQLWPLLLLLLLLLLTLGEYRLFRRLLFADQEQIGFVLANVRRLDEISGPLELSSKDF